MAPEPWIARYARACLFAILLMVATAPVAHALRIVNHNITNYPSLNVSGRNPHFRTIMGPLGADIVVTQEMQSSAGVDSFRNNVLNVLEPGQWSSATFTNGNDTDNALFYKPSRVQLVGQRSFYVSVDATRLVNEYRLKPIGYTSAAAELRIYSLHLKSSTGAENVAQRLREATGLRDTINNVPPGTPCIVMGDFNVYSGSEGAFTKFLESQADNDGRLYDPLNAPAITWNTASLSPIHTQSPCATCPSGFSTGGLDDRFDMFLPTYSLKDGDGFDLLVSTYKPVGNDGLHYNLNITDAPTIPEGAAYATALWNASDHLPIRVDLMIPARVNVGGGPFAFGTVITGATATTSLTVGNPATPPADTLEYTLSASSGFTAPPGSFTRLAGPGSDSHTIGMDTSMPGEKLGTAIVHSNSLDTANYGFALTGTVIRHASPSLDSASVVTADTLKFLSLDPGLVIEQSRRVHDQGFDALQAQLSVFDAEITGPDAGRFAIVGGFTPTLISGVGHSWTVGFDSTGVAPNTTYEATLVFSTADEALPGATAASDLVLYLVAGTQSTVGVPGEPVGAPLSFAPPRPNPLRGSGTEFQFGLPRPARVSLAVYDATGRLVARLIDGERAAGMSSIHWNGRNDAGAALPAGLYFVRFATAGLQRTARLVILP